MRFLVTLGALISGATLAACGGVVVAEKSSGATGAGGATVTSSTTFTYPGVSASISSSESVGTTTPGVTVGGVGGSGSGVGGSSNVSAVQASSSVSSTSTGEGGSGLCGYETHEILTIVLELPTGAALGCYLQTAPPSQGSVDEDIQGIITQTSANIFTIDSCPPNADCLPSVSKLAISAPGLFLATPIPSGSFVDLHMTETVAGLDGCADVITITNLPSWGSIPNPVNPAPVLLFAGADGAVATVPNSPFTVSAQGLGCFPNDPNCGTPHDDFTLVFSTPGSVATVAMGELTEWVLDGPVMNQIMAVHNLRSFASGACDDPGQWGYWMTPSNLL